MEKNKKLKIGLFICSFISMILIFYDLIYFKDTKDNDNYLDTAKASFCVRKAETLEEVKPISSCIKTEVSYDLKLEDKDIKLKAIFESTSEYHYSLDLYFDDIKISNVFFDEKVEILNYNFKLINNRALMIIGANGGQCNDSFISVINKDREVSLNESNINYEINDNELKIIKNTSCMYDCRLDEENYRDIKKYMFNNNAYTFIEENRENMC